MWKMTAVAMIILSACKQPSAPEMGKIEQRLTAIEQRLGISNPGDFFYCANDPIDADKAECFADPEACQIRANAQNTGCIVSLYAFCVDGKFPCYKEPRDCAKFGKKGRAETRCIPTELTR